MNQQLVRNVALSAYAKSLYFTGLLARRASLRSEEALRTQPIEQIEDRAYALRAT
ncbi:MAG: hypothetical protein ACT4QE_16905 [Anaerolineales bacterium]